MEIASVIIERADARSYCGLMTYRDAGGPGRLWWSVERIDTYRVRVGFVQGDRDEWLDTAELYAPMLSDGILEAIAHRRRPVAIAG